MNALAILYVNAHLQDLLDEAAEARRIRCLPPVPVQADQLRCVESHRHAGGADR